MLEIELVKKLVEAHTLWVTPPYYTNDAQDVIKQAVNLATDTEWEKELQEILEPEIKPPTLEQLEAMFLQCHPKYKKENIGDLNAFLQDSDRFENDRIRGLISVLIYRIGEAVSDKVHRRNLQIADLKKQLAAKR